jgi:cyclic beta-1,2-glucan synthetase
MMKSSFFSFWKRSESPLSIHTDNLLFLNTPLRNLEPFCLKSQNLLSGVVLAQHARELARVHNVRFDKRTSHRFATCLRKTYETLSDDYLSLTTSLQERETSASGSEWIVDNFYLVEELVQSCAGFFASLGKRDLPILLSGKFAGLPRVYQLARELFDHTDSLISKQDIDIFIDAYQEITKLTLEELLAFPHFLHLALLENLLVFANINVTLYRQQKAAMRFREDLSKIHLTSQLQHKLENQTVGTIIVLLQSLKEAGPLARECLQLIANKCHSEDLVGQVLHIKSAYQISISNIFGTLRNVTNIHWNNWFEHHSNVHALLQTDPTGIYGLSEFQTREQCRAAIQRLSATNSSREGEIAQSALDFAFKQGLEHK